MQASDSGEAEHAAKLPRHLNFLKIHVLTPRRMEAQLDYVTLASHLGIMGQMEKQIDTQKFTGFDLPRRIFLQVGTNGQVTEVRKANPLSCLH